MVMYGMTVNAANIIRPDTANALRWLGSANTWPMPRQTLTLSGWCKCASSRGKVCQAPNASKPTSAAMPTNGACQLKCAAKNRPSGTPATVDTEKEVITTLMARPRRSKGITSATMVWDRADKTPPNKPAATRATINQA